MMVLGCKVNDYEATYLKQVMDKDYQEVSFKEVADIYVIFTCCVTNMAESKTRKFINQARRRNPNAYIVAVGCLSQVKPENNVFEQVNLLIGSKYKDKIKEYIDEHINANMVSSLQNVEFENLYIDNYSRKNRAFLKIQDGCNQYCSYCIIPFARGRERSGKLEQIVLEAKQLAKNAKEIVLTGIHTGRYFDGENHLIDLLKALEQIEDLQTVRLSSIEITELSDELLQFMQSSKKMAHHLHIPLQAGSDHILKLMNRPYDTEYFLKRVAYIRSLMPGISISTDLIVGFPQESDDDFNETIELLKKVKFSFIHLFPYARKAKTKADSLDGHIDARVKKQREEAVNDVQKPLSLAFKQSHINSQSLMFIEKHDNGYSYGYTSEYLYTRVKGEYPIGDVFDVNLIAVENDIMLGEICS